VKDLLATEINKRYFY